MKKAALFALLAIMSGPLAAADGGLFAKDAWYDGIYFGAGSAFLRIDTDISGNGLAPQNETIAGNDDFKKTSIASNFFLGYRIIRYAGIELGYFKAYDVERSYCFTDTSGDCTTTRGGGTSVVSSSAWTVELPTSGWTAALTGFFPINDTFEIMAKIGGVAADVDGNGFEKVVGGFIPPKGGTVVAINTPIATSVKGSGWDAMGALGVNFNAENGFSVRAQLDYFNIKEIDEPWMLSLNAIYNF